MADLEGQLARFIDLDGQVRRYVDIGGQLFRVVSIEGQAPEITDKGLQDQLAATANVATASEHIKGVTADLTGSAVVSLVVSTGNIFLLGRATASGTVTADFTSDSTISAIASFGGDPIRIRLSPVDATSGSATQVADADRIRHIDGLLSGTAQTTQDAIMTSGGVSDLAATAQSVADPTMDFSGASDISGQSLIAVDATYFAVVDSISLTASATQTTQPTRVRPVDSEFVATSITTQDATRIAGGVVTTTGTASQTTDASRTAAATITMVGTATTVGDPGETEAASASLSSQAVIDAVAVRISQSTSALAATASQTADADRIRHVLSNILASATLAPDASRTAGLDETVSGIADQTADSSRTAAGQAIVDGFADLDGALARIAAGASTVSGTASQAGDPLRIRPGSSGVSGQATQDATGIRIQPVDATITGLATTSIAAFRIVPTVFDAHISYSDSVNDGLKYATGSPGDWTIEVVDATTPDSSSVSATSTSVTVDPSRTIHIVYGDRSSGLKHAVKPYKQGWSVSTIDATVEVDGVDIVVDSIGDLHVGIWDPVTANGSVEAVRYTTYDGTWSSVTDVDAPADARVGRGISIDVNSSDLPRISYGDRDNNDVKYASFDGTSWTKEIIHSTLSIPNHTSLYIDSNDDPHTVWTADAGMEYSTKSGTWSSPEKVFGGSGVSFSASSLIVGSDGLPQVVFEGAPDLVHGIRDTGWTTTNIDMNLSGYADASIRVDDLDRARINFSTPDELGYAEFNGSWSVVTVEAGNFTESSHVLFEEPLVIDMTGTAQTTQDATRTAGVDETLAAQSTSTADPTLLASGSSNPSATATTTQDATADFTSGSQVLADAATTIIPERIAVTDSVIAAEGTTSQDAFRERLVDSSPSGQASSTQDATRTAGGVSSVSGAGTVTADASLEAGLTTFEYYQIAFHDQVASNDRRLSTAARPVSGSSWEFTTLATGSRLPEEMEFDVAPNGNLFVSSNVWTDLSFFERDDTGWSSEVVATVSSGTPTAVSSDSNNVPRIAYIDSSVQYTARNGGTWDTPETIETPGSTLGRRIVSMVTDSSDVDHVIWIDDGTSMKYANNSGGSFGTPESVDTADVYGFSGCDLAIDGSDNLYAVWGTDASPNGQVRYASRTSGTWDTIENVWVNTADQNFDVVITHDGTIPHVSGVKDGSDDVLHSQRSGGTWDGPTTVHTGSFALTDISINDAGNPIITYGDKDGETLSLAVFDGTSWNTETVSTDSAEFEWSRVQSVSVEEYYSRIVAPIGSVVSHWSLDETSGTTAQDRAGTNDGTINGNPVLESETGVYGGGTCYVFDGTDDYVEVPDDASMNFDATQDFSVSCWFRNDSASGSGQELFISENSVNHPAGEGYYYFSVATNDVLTVRINEESSTSILDGTTNLRDGNWHHVVLTIDRTANEAKAYIDGSQEDTTKDITGFGPITGSGDDFGIGARDVGTAGQNEFNGAVDEVTIFSKTLTISEVENLFDGGRP